MFIERSTARIRMARALFVLLGVLPCAGIVGWAAVRHSAGYRDALERRFEGVIGLPLEIGGVEHLRPDGLRLRDCRLRSATGKVVLVAPEIEVESSPGELRLRLEKLDCTPELARTLVGLCREWLRQPVRFPMDCVIEVEDFCWRPRPPAAPAMASGFGAGSLRVECVAANGSRAVRLRRSRGGEASDEVRVVVGVGGRPPGLDPDQRSDDMAGEADAGQVLELHGSVAEPLPIGVVEAIAGLEADALPFGEAAAVTGDVTAVLAGGVSSGSAHIRAERIDLATASSHLPHRLSGEASLDVERLEWSLGKIVACECRWSVSRGRVGQRLLEACVSVLGCRPGPAFRSLAREELRSFDDMAGRLKIESGVINLLGEPGRDGCMVRIQGMSMLDEPHASVSLDRLAWLLAPAGSAAVPAAGITGWLLGWFVVDSPARTTPDQAGRPLQRKEF